MVLRGGTEVSVSNGFTTVMQESSQCLIWYQIILDLHLHKHDEDFSQNIQFLRGEAGKMQSGGMSSQSLLLFCANRFFRQTRLERLIAVKTFTRIEKKLWRTPEDKTNVLG